jgi:hypothetical protein
MGGYIMKLITMFGALMLLPLSAQAQEKSEKPAVFWTQSSGNYAVNVRSVGDTACAVDLINTAEERLINLVRDARSGNYSLSMIVADYGGAPVGRTASLRIQTTGATGMGFDYTGTVQSSDDAFQTIIGGISNEQADSILKSDRVTIQGDTSKVIDMAVPSMLRVQARLKLISCHLDRM